MTGEAASSTAASRNRRRWCGRPTSRRSSCTPRWRWLPTSTRRERSCSTSIRARSTSIVDCCEVALGVRDVLASVGLRGLVQDVGIEGPAAVRAAQHRGSDARGDGRLRARRRPGDGTPDARTGHHGDGQGRAARQDLRRLEPERAATRPRSRPYSLRARHDPTVSTPVTWDEVEQRARDDGVELRFEAADVLDAGRCSSATSSPRSSPSSSTCPPRPDPSSDERTARMPARSLIAGGSTGLTRSRCWRGGHHGRWCERRRLRALVCGRRRRVDLAACSSPTAESEGPPSTPAAASSTELFDIAEPDPLPFPGYDVDRVTIAPLPAVGRTRPTEPR